MVCHWAVCVCKVRRKNKLPKGSWQTELRAGQRGRREAEKEKTADRGRVTRNGNKRMDGENMGEIKTTQASSGEKIKKQMLYSGGNNREETDKAERF